MTIVLLVLAIVAGAGAASTACGVDIASLETRLIRESGGHMSPLGLRDGWVLFVERDCASDDYIPTQPGTLLALHLQSGATETLGRDSYSARFL